MTFILLPPPPKWNTTMPVLCGVGDWTQGFMHLCKHSSNWATLSAWCHLALLHILVYWFSVPGKWQWTLYFEFANKNYQGKHLLPSRANHIHSWFRLILTARSFWSSSIDTCHTAWKFICLRSQLYLELFSHGVTPTDAWTAVATSFLESH